MRDLRLAFRKLLEKEAIQMPGAYNALTAKLAERLGFKGVYISGGALSAQAGLPDIGLLTQTEFALFSKFIVQATSLPCFADADTGFGEALNVMRTVQEYEAIGLCGMHIEDQVFPKRCGHLSGKEVVTTKAMCEKIRMAVRARKDPNFLICARTDSRAIEGLESAIDRAKAYQDAGADIIFPEAMKDAGEFATFSQKVGGLLLANMTEFGKSPLLSFAELSGIGYKIVIYPVSALRVSMKAVDTLYSTIKSQGTQQPCVSSMQTRDELYELLGYDSFAALDEKVAHFRS